MIQSSIRKANPKPAGNMGDTEFLFLARLVIKKDMIQAKLKGTNKYKAISHIGNSVCRLVNRVIAKMIIKSIVPMIESLMATICRRLYLQLCYNSHI